MHDIDLIRAYRDDVGDDEDARAAARDRLHAHIAAGGATRGDRRPRRMPRRLAVALAALLVVSSTAAATTLLLGSDDLDLGSVACLDSARTIQAPAGSATFVEPTADPVAACASLWRAGDIDGRSHDRAPALVACASSGNPVVVIPGGPATCRALDLEPLPRDYAAAATMLGRAKAILQRDGDLHRPQSRCDDPAAVLARARGLLADAGVRGFPVELAGDRPCAGVYLFDGGAVAHIETLSRAGAAAYFERAQIATALEPLLAAGACVQPRDAAARARALLQAAGLAGVTVRVEGDRDACVDLGGFTFGDGEVVLNVGGGGSEP